MNKVEFESYYKFIVSIGVVLFSLPLFILSFLIKENGILFINRIEISNFTTEAQKSIVTKQYFYAKILQITPYFTIALTFIGLALVIWGSILWYHRVQRHIDKKQELDNKKQELEIQGMIDQLNPIEGFKKAQEKVEKMDVLDEETDSNNDSDNSTINNLDIRKSIVDIAFEKSISFPSAQIISKYLEVEDLVYKNILSSYGSIYDVRSNVKLGQCEYDIVLFSPNLTNYIVEVKLSRSKSDTYMQLRKAVRKLESSLNNYLEITKKVTRAVLVNVFDDESFNADTQKPLFSYVKVVNISLTDLNNGLSIVILDD